MTAIHSNLSYQHVTRFFNHCDITTAIKCRMFVVYNTFPHKYSFFCALVVSKKCFVCCFFVAWFISKKRKKEMKRRFMTPDKLFTIGNSQLFRPDWLSYREHAFQGRFFYSGSILKMLESVREATRNALSKNTRFPFKLVLICSAHVCWKHCSIQKLFRVELYW